MEIRVAIFEDNKLMRNGFEAICNGTPGLKCTGVFADCGDLELKINRSQPNVVLMDIEMPELNGIDTIMIAKELYADIQFIMLTTFEDDDKIFEAIKAGASGYLLKEEKTEKIIEALVTADEGAPMSPRIARKTIRLLTGPPPVNEKKECGDPVLSEREMSVLKLIVDGLNYQQIAEKIFISPLTVKQHIKNIYRKLHVNSKLSAVKVAQKKGWFR